MRAIFVLFQSYERMNLADALVTKTFDESSVIVNQGDVGDGMYFGEEGQVDILMQGNDGIERKVSKGKLPEGGGKGEGARMEEDDLARK